MSISADSFLTIAAPSAGEFKDRGSKFLAFAFPAASEEVALEHLEQLRRLHFKARHHCYAWRMGVEGTRFRANDDGEPSGTAGRPILGQIDSAGLTDVAVVVVRYFGGTLLGTSGLINAYREAAADALRQAGIVEKIISLHFDLQFDYSLMPDLMQALKKLDIAIVGQQYGDSGKMEIALRKNEAPALLLQLRAQLWKVSQEEAETLAWPAGLQLEPAPI